MRRAVVIAVNVVAFLALLGAIELYFRLWHPAAATLADQNALWQRFQPYVMHLTGAGTYDRWINSFTGELYGANVKTNSLGFNDGRELSYTHPYAKAPNERVVLFTGGSSAWGVGATANDTTIAARMQFHLNSLQTDHKYTVINLSMGSWIAYQQFIALELWGEVFKPDWIVMMDGHNDAGVGCGYSQGLGNPMYFATVQGYVDGYLYSTLRPVFYRGWIENELIKHSAAYRAITGKEYVANKLMTDESSPETGMRRQIIPTRVGESRDIVAFYLKAERATLRLYPQARYILSTQPMVNQLTGDFVDIYDFPAGSPARHSATAKREAALEQYLKAYENEMCGQKVYQPSFTYIFVNGAIRLERLVEEARASGRKVEYHNIGRLFPDARAERMPYFIDGPHLTDKGNDVIGRFYAERILAAEPPQQ